MPNIGRVDVTIYREQIDSLFNMGGDAQQFGLRLVRQIGRVATARAPLGAGVHGGHLKFKHSTTGWLKEGKLHGRTSVINTSGHAAAVHGGTHDGIHSLTGRKMPIPVVVGGRGGKVFKKTVHGQSANPWLQKAANDVIRSGAAGVKR